MTRIAPAQPRGLDPIRRFAYRSATRMFGDTLEPTGVVAHHRPLLLGYGALSIAQERYATSVESPLKSLAMLRAAQLVGCEWCLDFGSKLARESGAPDEQLRELSHWRESERFSERERLVLEYAEAITRTPVDVGEELFNRLREHFDERQLVELTMSITLENLHARFNWAFGIESQGFSDGAYCVRPDQPVEAFADIGRER